LVLTKVKILISTLFDCTTTGVVGRFREERGEFNDQSGQLITSPADWEQARNQQRNYETLVQVLSLRTQLDQLTPAVKELDHWSFTASTDRSGIFGDDFHYLLEDCENVPMITGLKEFTELPNQLRARGSDANIWFKEIE
jgi:hypothetical protein